jgi:UDP:flavonoid glycosyltransferase YjiC (YdhE family)
MSRWSASAFTALGRHVTAAWVQPVTSLAAALNIVDAGHPLYEGQFSPHGTLAMFSPVLGPPQPDWPPHAVATGFVFHQEGHALDARLQGFLDAGPPPIVFTLGSSAVGAPGRFWHESLDAIAALRQRAVLLVGRHEAAPTLPPSSDVFVTDYAPHAPLFAAASAIVHHGGVGTTGQAMRAGKPMLVVPHAHDQPDNAFRVRRLGLARVLDAGRYRAPAVAGHLRRLAMDDGYRIRSAEVGRVVDAERGADRACAVMLAACR